MIRYRLLFCLPILYLLSTGCCTIIGGAIGKNTETVEIHYKEIEMSEYSKIEKGTNLKIILAKGDSLKGDFIEFKKLSMSEYSKEYAKMRKVNDGIVFFPELHDTIKVTYRNKSVQYYEFLGFDYGCIQVGNFNDKVYNISLNNIYKLTFCGNDYAPPSKRYEDIMAKGQIPFLSTIAIQKNGIVINIPLNDISQIILILHKKKNQMLEGSLVGLGIDAIIVFLWLQANPIPYFDWDGV